MNRILAIRWIFNDITSSSALWPVPWNHPNILNEWWDWDTLRFFCWFSCSGIIDCKCVRVWVWVWVWVWFCVCACACLRAYACVHAALILWRSKWGYRLVIAFRLIVYKLHLAAIFRHRIVTVQKFSYNIYFCCEHVRNAGVIKITKHE